MLKTSSPLNASSSPTELKVGVFTDVGDTPVSNRCVVFTEDHLSSYINGEEVATSEDTNEQVQEAQELSVTHKIHEDKKPVSVGEEDEDSASVSPQSEGKRMIFVDEDEEPASVGEEDEDSASVSPQSEGNKMIFVDEEHEEPASISPSPSPSRSHDSDGDPEASETISVNKEDKESGSYSAHSDGDSGHNNIFLFEDEEPPLVSYCSDRDLGWNISPSVTDEEPQEYQASPKLDYYSERDCTIFSHEEEPQETEETFNYKTYVKLFISKIVYQIYTKANMKPQNSDDLIAYLYEYIWERVKDEDICITDDSFRKMDDKIQKILRKELGNPNKVFFLLKYSEEPVVADCMVTILCKLLKRESKKSNSFSRFFSHKAQKLWKFLTCCITPAAD